VDEEIMTIVRNIFRWIGIEGWSMRRVRKTLDDLGIEPPGGHMNKSRMWNETQLRRIVANDAYRPHSFEEVELLVAPDVAATLDPEKHCGIWWWGRERHRMSQVSEQRPSGKVYKKVTRSAPVPEEEWVAVPVPDAGCL
jgi:hypothetical protein